MPNRIGRTLNTGKSNTIALLMMTSVDITNIVHKTSLFYYLQQGVLAVGYQANYSLRLDVKSHEDPDLMDYFERVVGDRTLDGIIIVPQYLRDYPFLYPLRQRSFPYVMMRPACFGADVNYVDLDNYHGGQLVAQQFAQRGCQRVAMINGPETHVDAMERERGFFEGLVAAGVKKVTKRYGDFTIPSGTTAMESILTEFTPDGVFCSIQPPSDPGHLGRHHDRGHRPRARTREMDRPSLAKKDVAHTRKRFLGLTAPNPQNAELYETHNSRFLDL